MSLTSSSLSQIRAQVESIHRKHEKYSVFGIRMSTRLPVAERSEVNGRDCFFNWCDSVLQIRELLVERDRDRVLQVVLTNLNENELGQDLLARFAKNSSSPTTPGRRCKNFSRRAKLIQCRRRIAGWPRCCSNACRRKGIRPPPAGYWMPKQCG